jgi:hypothetical protein
MTVPSFVRAGCSVASKLHELIKNLHDAVTPVDEFIINFAALINVTHKFM